MQNINTNSIMKREREIERERQEYIYALGS